MDPATQESSARPVPRKRARPRLGPGLIIAASFIGPGTVTTATVTGASHGYALMWAIVFSVFATAVLQEMSARLGLVTRQGLGETLRSTFSWPCLRVAMVVLVIGAIGIGEVSYASGDTTGTALGLATVTSLPQPLIVVLVGVVVLVVLGGAGYKRLERLLTLLVGVMSVVFVLAAVVAGPDLGKLAAGLFVPSIPDGALLTTIALVGTTVVPYNVFLHASIVQEQWPDGSPRSLRAARRNSTISISIGGLITLAVVATAAATLYSRGLGADSSAALADQLKPLLGSAANYVFGLGLFSAGLTSAIAGPLGAAYAITSVLGWSTDLSSPRFKTIWAFMVVCGVVIALSSSDPVALIVVAQAANGVLLPVVAIFLLVVMNRWSLLGQRRNRLVGNVLGGLVVLVVTGLGAYQLADVLGMLPG